VAAFGAEAEDAAAAFEAAEVAFEAAEVEVSEAAEEAGIAVDAAGVIAAAVAVEEDAEEAEVGSTTVIATAIMVATEDINQEDMAVVTEQTRVVAITKAEEVTIQEVEAATSSRVVAEEATSRAAGAATEQTRAAPRAEDTEQLATLHQVNTGLLRQGVTNNNNLQVILTGLPVVQPVNTQRSPLQAASMGLRRQHHQQALGEAIHTTNSMALGQLTAHNRLGQQLHMTQRNRQLLEPLGNSNSMVHTEGFYPHRI